MVNPSYLTKIHKASKPLTLHTNTGSSNTTHKGYLGLELFWLNCFGIVNVVSLHLLERKYRVQYDSRKQSGAFVCKTTDGEVVFKRCPLTKFPYVDLNEQGDENDVLLVQTVCKNYEGFTRREVERAILARKLQARSGHPSKAVFKNKVSRKSESSLFRDYPISSKDISNAKIIFGPSKPCVEGKWVQGKPKRVEPSYVSILANLIITHRYLTLVGCYICERATFLHHSIERCQIRAYRS